MPDAQFGLQLSSLYVPVPTASVADQVVQLILYRNAVESPDSAHPKPPHAGSCNGVPLVSCPGAKNVFAPVCAAAVLGAAVAVTLGEETGVAVTVGEAGALAGPVADTEAGGGLEVAATAELPVEPHAVISKTAPASPAQGAIRRAAPPLVVHIMSNPFNALAARRAMSHLRRPRHPLGWKLTRSATDRSA